MAFGVYLVASFVLFGRPLLDDPSRTCLCIGSTTDAGVIAWALEWWPHALLHGLNPFHPRIIYAPQGIDIAQGALMPGLALVSAIADLHSAHVTIEPAQPRGFSVALRLPLA